MQHTEIFNVHTRIQEVSEAIKTAQGKEKETMEILLDSLYDTEDLLLENFDSSEKSV